MIYEKKGDLREREGYPLHEWGSFTRYLEIGDDLYTVRQVDLFANGNGLRYDRKHWRDGFGMLAEAKYNEKWDEWWGPAERISDEEFEEAWQLVGESISHRLQLSSRVCDGSPPWIPSS